MDTGINVGSGNGSNLGKDIGVNIDSKIGIESPSCGSGSHSYSSSISLNENLPICQWVDIGQVQDFVLKLILSQSFQDAMILCSINMAQAIKNGKKCVR